MRFIQFLIIVAAALTCKSALAQYFEPAADAFVAHTRTGSIRVQNDSLSTGSSSVTWLHNSRGAVQSDGSATGSTLHATGSAPERWTKSPHFARVRRDHLYPGVDSVYYFSDVGQFEFDLIVHPGASPESLVMRPTGLVNLNPDGSVEIRNQQQGWQLLRPFAWQQRGADRRQIPCSYVLRAGLLTIKTGPYDHQRDLIIDPVVQALTYLGGSGTDQVQAVAADPSGNILTAGVTTSPNFPGGGPANNSTQSLFVSKLSPDARSVLFTVLLGSLVTSPVANFQYITSMDSDAAGNIYVLGSTIASNFPTTPGTWQPSSTGAFLIKISAGGAVVWSTYMGSRSLQLRPRKIVVRGSTAFIAGDVGAPEFLGTAGAFQRNLAGGTDVFAMQMAGDGSAPVFLTAFGGSGQDNLQDFTMDSAGNLLLAGISASSDLPLTSDALTYRVLPQGSAFLARIDSTGSTLISSTYLGTQSISGVALLPDGGVAIGGSGTLPADLIASGAHTIIYSGIRQSHAYIAKLRPVSNQPAWTTDLQDGEGVAYGLTADTRGEIYWPDYIYAPTGGAPSSNAGWGVNKLSADGSLLLFSGSLPVTSVLGVATPDGHYYLGGYTSAQTLPATAGAVQPLGDPATGGTPSNPANPYDAYAGVLDLSSFTSSNFAVPLPQSGNTIAWRIGEPLPVSTAQPIRLVGDPGLLVTTPSSRLTASFSSSPAPVVAINVARGQNTPGTFNESVIVQSPANAAAAFTLPVQLKVLPQVSFDLASTQANIQYSYGLPPQPAKIAVTTHFGNEYFNFFVTSSLTSIYGSVDLSGSQPTLTIFATGQPGTYDATLTVGLTGLQNTTKTVSVHAVIAPAGQIQLSSSGVSLHVIQGQASPVAVVNVTGNGPALQWSLFVGRPYTWLSLTQTSMTTPGSLQVSVDSSAAPVGLYFINVNVTPAGGQAVQLNIQVDVSSGAPIDVMPSSISATYLRSPTGVFYSPSMALISAVSGTQVQLNPDQPWIQTSGTFGTPNLIYIALDLTLPEGAYKGNIKVTSGNTNITVPVTWTINDSPHLLYSSTPINFQWTQGTPLPPSVSIKVTAATALQEYVSVGPTDYPSFLTVTPSSGATPLNCMLSVNPGSLGPGTYKTNFSVTGSYPDSTVYPWVPVTFTILPNPNAPKSVIASIVDAASYLPGVLAPGEIAVLFGSGLGPASLIQAQPSPAGIFPASLAGWTVSFDGVAAPVIYASDKQTAVVVPFEIAGKSSAAVTVSASGNSSAPLTVQLAAVNPSVFTANASGSGNAAAINYAADGSTGINSASAPIARGDIIALYVSGLGITTPALGDGALAAAPLPALNALIRVQIGGVEANVLYAGPAPSLIAGLGQINVRIPQVLPAGSSQVIVLANGLPSQPGVTLSLR